MQRWGIWLGVGILAGLAVAAAIVLSMPYELRGSQVTPPVAASDFTLPDGKGGTFTLGAQQGKVTLLFFGYTACPDVCPTSLSEMKQVRRALGDRADDAAFVFISVDPERDTPERTAKYAASFDPAFFGLSGTEAQLSPVWQAYGVYHEKRASASAAGYLVDHSAFIYVIDKAGNLRETFAFGSKVENISSDVRFLVKE